MSNLQKLSATLPDYVKDALAKSESSTYQKHLGLNGKYLRCASVVHPYSVFNPAFSEISATAKLVGISAASQDNAKYPNGVRKDTLLQYENSIVGQVYTSPSSASCQQGNILRIKDRGERVPHMYPATEDGIKPYETVEKLWPKD